TIVGGADGEICRLMGSSSKRRPPDPRSRQGSPRFFETTGPQEPTLDPTPGGRINRNKKNKARMPWRAIALSPESEMTDRIAQQSP
ncbi:MAG: hypothetical protein WAN05_14065, partial [Roseiarcus sp.]